MTSIPYFIKIYQSVYKLLGTDTQVGDVISLPSFLESRIKIWISHFNCISFTWNCFSHNYKILKQTETIINRVLHVFNLSTRWRYMISVMPVCFTIVEWTLVPIWTGSWVSPRTGLDVVAKRINVSNQESNPHSSNPQPFQCTDSCLS
jgi:hypothetical protein